MFQKLIFSKTSAGDGIRTREGTHPLGPQPSAFDRSTTPAVLILTQESKAYHHLSLSLFKGYFPKLNT